MYKVKCKDAIQRDIVYYAEFHVLVLLLRRGLFVIR